MCERLYRQGQEQKKKLAAQIRATPEGCTFKPNLTAKAKAKQASPGERLSSESRCEQLFKGARNKEKYEQMRRDSEIKDCTFAPTLSSGSKKLAKRNSPDRKSRIHSLYLVSESMFISCGVTLRCHQDAERKRERFKMLEDIAATKGCTFKPKINHGKVETSSERKLRQMDRLSRTKDFEALERQKEELELEGCTFSPNIVDRADKGKTTKSSFLERMDAQSRKNKAKLEQVS